MSVSPPSSPAICHPTSGLACWRRQLVESLHKVRCAKARAIKGHDCADVRGALVRISLAGIADPHERQRRRAIPTGPTIPNADVDATVSSSESLVLHNAAIRELISDLDSRMADGTAQAQSDLERETPSIGSRLTR